MKVRSFTIVVSSVLVLFAQTAAARDPWQGQPAYGRAMMTRLETDVYWNTLESFETYDEKLAFWLSEIERMQQRALEWGVQAPSKPRVIDPDAPPVVRPKEPYFRDIMEPEEVTHYYKTLEVMTDAEAEREFIRDHIMRMRARGFERGVSVPGLEGWQKVFGKRPAADVIP